MARWSIAFGLALSATAGAQGTKSPTPATVTPKAKASYTRDLPDSLKKVARIDEAAASVSALAKVPNGKIAGVELEREGGKLLYSYDIKVAGKSGIEEVHVDAMTGAVIGEPEHENAATEKKEAADEAKEKKAPKPAATKPPVKKPPV